MFVDARTIPNGETLEADLCVVGGGAAGIALTREFIGTDARVLLLESGGTEPDFPTQMLADGGNVGLPYFPLAAARLRFLGGTTNHWGGTCRPFEDFDFEPRPWVPRSGWPIRRRDLDGFYRRAESFCGLSSSWAAEDWLERDRFKPLSLVREPLITRIAQIIRKDRRRPGRSYRTDLERARNVTTLLNANLTELETDEGGKTVSRAAVACLEGPRFHVRARLFVLATGGLENARLLLASNRRHPAGLGNDYDQVGRYFMEHPRFTAATLLPATPRFPLSLYQLHAVRGGEVIKGYIAFTKETLAREGMLDVQIDLDPIYEDTLTAALAAADVTSFRTLLRAFRLRSAPDDLQTHVRNVLTDLLSFGEHSVLAAPVPLPTPAAIDRVLSEPPSRRAGTLVSMFGDIAVTSVERKSDALPIDSIEIVTRIEQAPNPDSRVTLTAERDQLGMPKLQLDWRLTELEKHSLFKALDIIAAQLGEAEVGRLRVVVSERDEGWPDSLRGGWHLIGTTRMSDSPAQGVVDRNCQVHGVSNLFIAGSSVFPTAGSGTPTLTLIALAIRLADHLKEQLR